MQLLPTLLLLVALTSSVSLAENNIETEKQQQQRDITNAIAKAPATYDHYRLPRSVRPEKYKLKIITHLEDPQDLKFSGDVVMKLRILEDTNNITLHAHNLTIDYAQIKLKRLQGLEAESNAGGQNCIKGTSLVEQHDYLILQLCQLARKGDEYILAIPFAAELNKQLRGYYRSSYLDRAKNLTRWLSITQFEPASARAAFPCFDEPNYKATFTVVMGHHKEYTALSNMPLKERKPMSNKPDWVWSEFEESVPMSTYLVAYSVNDFAFAPSETNLKSKVTFRTWARPEALDQCAYAGVVGPKVLQFYEDIFDLKFPLEKIDQIAIPDFSAGAMENWGLVTYRETALLYAKDVSSFASKQRVASVIAHELAHQWFGNLVTMKYWTDLWLNEGFATYVASLGVENIHPEWDAFVEESVDNTLAIFRVDALKSSHPISQPIKHVSEIFEIFDSISYKKGSTVLRMMHLFLGDESFRSGINLYLKRHAYANAEQDNLWAALTETAHEIRAIPESYDIKRIMDTWTLQTGYPIITVTRDYKNKTATVTQTRFLLDTEASRTADNNCWWVPLSYTTQDAADFSKTTPQDWLECDDQGNAVAKTLEKMPEDDQWIIFNVQMAGLYKVKYDDRNWNMLIDTLMSDDFKKIHIVNRAHLIDDALTLAWSGDQDYDVAMRLIEYLGREKEYIPWKAALENLANVHRIMRQTPEYEFFKKYMRKILTPIYIHLHGLNETNLQPLKGRDESGIYITVLHKVLIASWACRFDVDDCVPRALKYFNDWRHLPDPDETNPISKDLRSVVYCTAMRHGHEDDWQFLWERYKNSNVASEKRTILSALGCSREIWILQRYLEWSFEEGSDIRKQDAYYAFTAIARGEVGFLLAKDYFMSNIKFLHDFYAPDTSDLGHLLSPIASQMTTQHEYDNTKRFVEQHKKLLEKSEQGVKRALENIRLNAQWKENNYRDMSMRLRRRLEAQ